MVTGMTAIPADASHATGPGLGGPVRARTAGPAAADRSPAGSRPRPSVRSWSLLILAAPAAAEVWSGWVGIAQKTGFGLVSPLPGIWPSLHLDTAITLPVGVEAYAAYVSLRELAPLIPSPKTVPPQDRFRGDQQPQPLAPRFRYDAEQGREQCPGPPSSASGGAAAPRCVTESWWRKREDL